MQWLFPSMPQDQVDVIVTIARKGAHLTVYAVLAWLFWRAVWKRQRGDRRPWAWRQFVLPTLFVALYAATDEIHQHFVPNRYGSPTDVLLDTMGGAMGMLIVWRLREWRNPRRPDPIEL
jgi:VanZ family protein